MESSVRITFNAPVILITALMSLVILLFDQLTGHGMAQSFFATGTGSFLDLWTWFRLFFHWLYHASVGGFLNNITLFLILGPVLEKRYGSRAILLVILCTALLSGLGNRWLSSDLLQGMASVDVAFSILMAMSMCRPKEIPLSLILVILAYVGMELYAAMTAFQLATTLSHVSGGLTGFLFGLLLLKRPAKSA